MSTFTRPLRLFSRDRAQSVTFDATVDPSYSYSLVPASTLLRLGIDPEKVLAVTLPEPETRGLSPAPAKQVVPARW